MLPDKAREILHENRQCCLGTLDGEAPYLSLMLYSFIPEEEVIVMSSFRNSSKVKQILKNPRAAILVHEAEELENPVSLTLLGNIAVLAGQPAEYYRDLHSHSHPQQAQFIEGTEIAILLFTPSGGILADRQGGVDRFGVAED
ncbi:MAG: pyridoxamine 5'-phosphate oxidase family protein [Syntrophomonadaceae bacterium]